MKILFIHGIGFHESSTQLVQWVPGWVNAISTSATDHAGINLTISPPFGSDGKPSGLAGDPALDPGILYYENLIRSHGRPSTWDYAAGVSSLLASGVTTVIGDFFGRDRGFFDNLDELKWKAEEVIAWAQNPQLRANLRQRVVDEVQSKDPDIVIAHSYGGLILYDTCMFGRPDLLQNRHLITLGTQIGNPVLRKEFQGYQLPLNCRHWFNLYNPDDKVFVSSLEHIRAENFTQIITPNPVGNGHDGIAYLSNRTFAKRAWPFIVKDLKNRAQRPNIRGFGIGSLGPRAAAAGTPTRKRSADSLRRNHRALLVGIDAYANPQIPTLHGCVNDTFQLSAALQEAGLDHRQIRLIHNQRATRLILLDNIRWLLEDAQPGDHRIFSFSGHGHRRPTYDLEGEPLEMHEILCTHNYDPSNLDTGLRDADIQDLYANLPRDVHFTIFLDCCHAGGMTRAGGPAIRSFSGPADLEHESSKWNSDLEMWEQGSLLTKSLNPDFLPPGYHGKELTGLWQQLRTIQETSKLTSRELHEREKSLYYGQYGDTRRIGRATPLRDLGHKRYDKIEKDLRKLHPEQFLSKDGKKASSGPYLPLVFMACNETEKASEYVHGAISYGAFTYALTLTLRDIKHGRLASLNYGQLLIETARKLKTLGYTQTPDVLGPPDQLSAPTPFSGKKTTPKKAQLIMADFDDIVSAVRTKRVILFLGAGIHYHGQNGALSYQKSDRPLLAGELADQLSGGSHWYDRFNKTDYPARMNFTRVALDYELFSEEDAAAASTGQSNSTPPTVSSQQAKAWRLNGRQRLGVEVERAVQLGRRPSPLLGLLAEMGFPIVVTTNYDTLYENSVMLQNPQAKPVVRWYQASGAQKDTSYPIGRDPDGETPYIYKLHGHIGDPDSIVATDEDYIDFVIRMTQGGHSNSPMPLRILSRMAEVPTLFIGYSLVDYNMRLLLKTLSHGRDIFSNRENGGGFGFKSYAVSKYPDPLIQRVWQDQECAIGFLAEDIWDFIPRLHAAVQSK